MHAKSATNDTSENDYDLKCHGAIWHTFVVPNIAVPNFTCSSPPPLGMHSQGWVAYPHIPTRCTSPDGLSSGDATICCVACVAQQDPTPSDHAMRRPLVACLCTAGGSRPTTK